MSCVSGRPWTDEEKARLYRMRGEKDVARLLAAFPQRSRAAVLTAMKRCTTDIDRNAPARPINGKAVRRDLKQISFEVIADRLPELLKRGPLFGRPTAASRDERSA